MQLIPIVLIAAVVSLGDYLGQDVQPIDIPERLQVSGEVFWDHYSYCTVSPTGDKIVLLLPQERAVMAYYPDDGRTLETPELLFEQSHQSLYTALEVESFEPDSRLRTVAEGGRHQRQVQVPLAVRFADNGKLLVSDNAARRVSIFDTHLEPVNSFLLTGLVSVPSDMHFLSDSTILAVGLNLDTSSSYPNVGDYCTVLSLQGAQLQSFGYSPDIAMKHQLSTGVEALVDVDERGSIYQVFNVEGAVRVYDRHTTLIRTLTYRPTWFFPPEPLEPSGLGLQPLPQGYKTSWPRIVKLLHLPGDRLLIAAETNGHVPGVTTQFVLDIVLLSDGSCVATVASDYLPVDVDRRGNLYLISARGDKVLRVPPSGR